MYKTECDPKGMLLEFFWNHLMGSNKNPLRIE